jgi:hypothetical protein
MPGCLTTGAGRHVQLFLLLLCLLLVISAILFLGCLITTKNESNAGSAFPEKNEDRSADGIKPGHKPPKELKLSSILYELAVDPEPEKFAKKHGIFWTDGQVRVFISLNPASSNSDRDKLAENYNYAVEKESNDMLRALVPADRLIPLSKEPVVWSIRLPDRAIKQ